MDASTVLNKIINLSDLAYDAAITADIDELERVKDEMLICLKDLSTFVLSENDKPTIILALERYENICSVLEDNKNKYGKQISALQNGIEASKAYQDNQNNAF